MTIFQLILTGIILTVIVLLTARYFYQRGREDERDESRLKTRFYLRGFSEYPEP